MCDLLKLQEETLDDRTDIPIEQTETELRQRHMTTTNLADSYDFMDQDLDYLHNTMDDIATLIAQQEKQISRLGHLRYLTEHRISNATSNLKTFASNSYTTVATGAVLGGIIGGPVGFLMGSKIGVLVGLSGSALGALSMNVIQQKAKETNRSNDDDDDQSPAFHQAML